MRIQRMCLLAAALLLTGGCAEIAEPVAPDVGILQSIHAAPGHRVVGSGHVEANDALRELTFHAVEHPTEGVTGSYKVVLPNGLFFEADVTCLSVDGNTGWVAGTIRDTNAAVVVIGSTSMFYAIDGGEGEGATDVVSLAAINGAEGADLAFCATRPLALPPLTVTHGNEDIR